MDDGPTATATVGGVWRVDWPSPGRDALRYPPSGIRRSLLYRSRNASTPALGEYDHACRQHDAEMDSIRPGCLACGSEG